MRIPPILPSMHVSIIPMDEFTHRTNGMVYIAIVAFGIGSLVEVGIDY